jgi:hypothetical protein
MGRIIGLDLGIETHGLAVVNDGIIEYACNCDSDRLWHILTDFMLRGVEAIVIEDLAAYTGRLTPQVIDTAKFIGMAVYRIQCGYSGEVALVKRSSVKKWVFETYHSIIYPLCQIKADKGANKRAAKNGDSSVTYKTASFIYVDDRMVQIAMIEHYGIPKPKPGDGYEYGLREHSWQALAVATVWQKKSRISMQDF